MFIAMNRFKINLGFEEGFEKIWRERDSHLEEVPGYQSFALLKGETNEDHTLYASHTIWESRTAFEAWTQSEYFKKAHAQAHAPKGTYQSHPNLEVFESVIEGTEVVSRKETDTNNEDLKEVEGRTMLLPEEKEEIISHMNSDHADAVLTYVHYYAGIADASSATLDKVTEEMMSISASVGDSQSQLEVPLARRVSNIKEAEHVMVEMVFSARAKLAENS